MIELRASWGKIRKKGKREWNKAQRVRTEKRVGKERRGRAKTRKGRKPQKGDKLKVGV